MKFKPLLCLMPCLMFLMTYCPAGAARSESPAPAYQSPAELAAPAAVPPVQFPPVVDYVKEALEMNAKAESLVQRGKGSEAAQLARQALSVLERSFGPSDVQLAPVLNVLARATELEGKSAEAEFLYRRSLLLYESALGGTDIETSMVRINLANVLIVNNKPGEAQYQYEQALPILERSMGDNPHLVEAFHSLANLYDKQRNYGAAAQVYEHALTLQQFAHGEHSVKLVPVCKKLARLYLRQSRPDLAEPHLARLKTIREVSTGEESIDLAAVIADLAAVQMQQGKMPSAQKLYEQALSIVDKNAGKPAPLLISVLSGLAHAYARAGKPEAEMVYLRLLSHEDEQASATYGDDLFGLASLYLRSGRLRDAEPLLEKCLSVFETTLGPDDARLIEAAKELAATYEAQGKQLEALAIYERTAAISGISKQSIRASNSGIQNSEPQR